MINPEAHDELAERARRASERAHCIYSGFRVGACVLDSNGRMFTGANVENSSFGLTVCAERTAVWSAVIGGASSIVAVAIYTPTPLPTAPCGACRQVLLELAPDATVFVTCDSELKFERPVVDLLPDAFTTRSFGVALPKSAEAPPRLCVDIDNVVAQSDVVMREVINKITVGRVSLLNTDIQSFNYWECVDSQKNRISREEWNSVHERFSDSDVLSGIEPISGAIPALHELATKYNIHFATSRLMKARAPTVAWLEKNDFPIHDLHFIRHGQKHIALGHFDASVEDDPVQAEAFSKTGCGIHFVFSHPWNQCAKETRTLRRVDCWDEIVSALMQLQAGNESR